MHFHLSFVTVGHSFTTKSITDLDYQSKIYIFVSFFWSLLKQASILEADMGEEGLISNTGILKTGSRKPFYLKNGTDWYLEGMRQESRN